MTIRFTHRIYAVSALVLGFFIFALPQSASANSGKDYYSAKPLTLIVPYPAGGPSDLSARIFAESISDYLDQSVVVDNIGGATGTIAARRMLSERADGYTFFHGSPNELVLPTLVNKSITFKPEEFELVQAISTATIVVVTRADLDVQGLDDLIRLGQNSSGKPLMYASVGTGSMYHLITERLAKETNMNVQHIPYRGSAPALTDLAGGQVDFAVLAFQTSMIGLQNENRLNILSTLGTEAPAPLKDIPRVTDSELLKDFKYGITGGYFVKKGVSDEALDALRQAVSHALEQPDVREKLEIEGRIVSNPMSQEENRALWEGVIESMRTLVDIVEFEPV